MLTSCHSSTHSHSLLFLHTLCVTCVNICRHFYLLPTFCFLYIALFLFVGSPLSFRVCLEIPYRMRVSTCTSRVKFEGRDSCFRGGMAGGGKTTDLADLFAAHRGITSEKVTERKVRRPSEQSTSFCSALCSLTP